VAAKKAAAPAKAPAPAAKASAPGQPHYAPAPAKKAAAPAKKAPAKKAGGGKKSGGGMMGGMQKRLGGGTAVQRRQQANAQGQMTTAAPQASLMSFDPEADQQQYIPSEDEWLNMDPEYRDYLASLGITDAQAASDYQQQEDQTNADLTTQINQLKAQKPKSTEALNEEYAARGMASSGVFSNALKDLGTEFTNQEVAAQTGASKRISDIANQRTNYQVQRGLGMQSARTGAIRRRANKYGL